MESKKDQAILFFSSYRKKFRPSEGVTQRRLGEGTPSLRDTKLTDCQCGDDLRKFEPKKWLKFKDIDKSIQELRVIYKAHPGWFEVPKPKSSSGKNAVDYSIS